ncbi:MAG: hypothetical protein K2P17_00025 [Helicobacteraceae bacterium]|nr:hypothetical protein [Helicobacteraceae bacterium]
MIELVNKYNIFASTFDKIEIMREPYGDEKLLNSHIFQFDFLNDNLLDEILEDTNGAYIIKSKLPKALQNILKYEFKKLIIYINPPYAEAGNTKTGSNKR